jgi:hypothetical protein
MDNSNNTISVHLDEAQIEELYYIVLSTYALKHDISFDVLLDIYSGKTPLPPNAKSPLSPELWRWQGVDMGTCATDWCSYLSWITNPAADRRFDRAPPDAISLWNMVKLELHKLFCTQDKKYTAARKKINSLAGKSQLAITSAIASSLTISIGALPSVALTPLCAIVILALGALGKEVMCKRLTLEVTETLNRKLDLAIFQAESAAKAATRRSAGRHD